MGTGKKLPSGEIPWSSLNWWHWRAGVLNPCFVKEMTLGNVPALCIGSLDEENESQFKLVDGSPLLDFQTISSKWLEPGLLRLPWLHTCAEVGSIAILRNNQLWLKKIQIATSQFAHSLGRFWRVALHPALRPNGTQLWHDRYSAVSV